MLIIQNNSIYCVVINFPEEYVLPEVNREILEHPNFDVDKLEEIIKEQQNKKQQNAESLKADVKIDGCVKTFFDKIHDAVDNSNLNAGTAETLVDDLLRIVDLNCWPLK